MSATQAIGARPRRRWIWAIVALATAVVLTAPVVARLGLKADLQHENGPVTVYHRAITALRVNAPGDTVAITAGRPGQVSVASSLAWLVAKPVVREIWHGRTLAVSVRCPAPDLFEDCATILTVRVPAATGVRAAVETGAATVTRLTGPVRVAATSGTVALSYLSGPLWVTATSGSITGGNGLTPPTLTASAGSGSLALSLDSAPRSLSLAVGSGSGHLTVPPGTHYRLDASPGSEAVHMAPGMRSPGPAALIAARVGTGTLTIGYRLS